MPPYRPGRPEPLGRHLNHEPHVVTRDQAISQWGRRALESELAGGDVVRLLPGVYCGQRFRSDPLAWARGLSLWHPAGLVTGALALHLHRPQLPRPSIASLRVPTGQRPRRPSWVSCVQGPMPETRGRAQGLATVPTAWALVDAWRSATPWERRNVFYEALWQGAVRLDALRPVIEMSSRLPGRAELLRLVTACEAGATTPLEGIAREEVFVGPQFDQFEWQATLEPRHRRVRPDMLHREAKVIVELDGARYHSSREAQAADHERDIDLAAAGFITLRFGWSDLKNRPEWCRRRVLDVLEQRLAPRTQATLGHQ